MELKLTRRYKGPTYTVGSLFLNEKYFCDTIEDKDRGLDQSMSETEISKKKISSVTAIPTGTYIITLTQSNRFSKRSWAAAFGGLVPSVNNVKGFAGVRIHPGNTDKDTLGCILVGENKVTGKVINSVETWAKLMRQLTKTKEIIKLTIN